jgi:hypothetical protein
LRKHTLWTWRNITIPYGIVHMCSDEIRILYSRTLYTYVMHTYIHTLQLMWTHGKVFRIICHFHRISHLRATNISIIKRYGYRLVMRFSAWIDTCGIQRQSARKICISRYSRPATPRFEVRKMFPEGLEKNQYRNISMMPLIISINFSNKRKSEMRYRYGWLVLVNGSHKWLYHCFRKTILRKEAQLDQFLYLLHSKSKSNNSLYYYFSTSVYWIVSLSGW